LARSVPERPSAEQEGPEPATDATPSALDVARLATVPPRILAGLMVLLAGLVLFAELPGRPLILHSLQKAAHPTVFGAIAFGLLAIEFQRARSTRTVPAQYLRAFALATLIGALTEVAQLFTHRDPSVRDVWLDARGAAAALAFAMTFDARWRPILPRAWRIASFAAGLVLVGLILMPLAWATAGYARRSLEYPVLFAPGSSLDLLFVSLTAGSPELARAPTSLARAPQEVALRIPLQTRPYAGVTLDEPNPDWTGYDSLAIDVGNAGHNDLNLHVRVHDRTHDWTATDRFNGEVRIPAGRRLIVEFPIAGMRIAPNARRVDLSHVAGVALYRVGSEGPREFWLYRVELRRNGEHTDAVPGQGEAANGPLDDPRCADSTADGCGDARGREAR
jgi:VanZ family protein